MVCCLVKAVWVESSLWPSASRPDSGVSPEGATNSCFSGDPFRIRLRRYGYKISFLHEVLQSKLRLYMPYGLFLQSFMMREKFHS